MKFIVCIKQVPVIAKMTFDLETKTLKREGVPSEVSSFDIRALLKAVELKAPGDEVVVLTMGPPQARSALEFCLALGADRAIHLVDRPFAGSDTLATARALSLAIRREGYDLVLCGKNSTDAETAQVGPEVAELLDIPQVTAARTLSLNRQAGTATCERESDAGYETVCAPLPALITAAEDLAPERFPSRKDREAAKGKPIQEVRAADLSADLTLFGFEGSPTWVKGIEFIEVPREKRLLQEGALEQRVHDLVRELIARGLFSIQATSAQAQGHAGEPRSAGTGRAVWVVAEILGGQVRRITLELLSKATVLAEKYGGEVGAVLIGSGVAGHADLLAGYGADTVYLSDGPGLAWYSTEAYTTVLARTIQAYRPAAVLLGSTLLGRDLAPRVAARLQIGLTGDCIDLDLDADGKLLQYKPAFGGNIVAPILSKTTPEMATVRPGMFGLIAPQPGRQARVQPVPLDRVGEGRVRLLDQRPGEAADAAELDTADVVVGIGKGIGDPANLPPLRELAKALNAALAATRDVTDEGWLPKHYQVGLTGRAIAPRFYLAVGIRGAFEHLVGIRRVGTVVAINNDPEAEIFQAADLGLVADWAEAVPLLTREIQAARSAQPR